MTKKSDKKRKGVKKHPLLVSYGDFILPPVIFSPEVVDLCNKLDNFYKEYPKQHKRQKASELIKGAFYATREECRFNPDWMGQSAHSMREVLYPLWMKNSDNNTIKLFRKYAKDKDLKIKIKDEEFVKIFCKLDKIYGETTDLAHHGTDLEKNKNFSENSFLEFSENDFKKLMIDFVSVLSKALSFQQIYIHKIVDLLSQRKAKTEEIKGDLSLIFTVNNDAKEYFFSKIGGSWLNWLWDNDFLDELKKKSEDPTRYGGWKFPELSYLARIAPENPKGIVEIMLKPEVATKESNFNPGIIDRFLWICGDLPARELKRMVSEIESKKWVPLMGAFNNFGFEYEKMFKTLRDAGDDESIVTLAKVILSVRPEDEIKKGGYAGDPSENPLYFSDLSQSGVFDFLLSVDDKHKKGVFRLLTDVISMVAKLGVSEKDGVFKLRDVFHLYDVDLFDAKQAGKRYISHRANLSELIVMAALVVKDLIGGNCDENNGRDAKEIFDECIGSFDDEKAKLPDTQAMWKLRLFMLSLCPEAFKDGIKKSLFRLFDKNKINYEVKTLEEYKHLLKVATMILSRSDQEEYQKTLIKLYKIEIKKTDTKEQKRHLEIGGAELLCVMRARDDAQKQFGIDCAELDFGPRSPISVIRSGFVEHQAPDSQENFDKKDIDEVVELLSDGWKPDNLKKKEDEDMFKPVDAEGVSDLIRRGTLNRFKYFIENAERFFDKKKINPHYTYSFLMGVQEAIKNDRERARSINWGNLIDLCLAISNSKPTEERNGKKKFGSWLVGWDAVLMAMADVLQELLNGEPVVDFKKHRKELLEIIDYLVGHKDPKPEHEELEKAKIKTQSPNNKDYVVSDPYTVAINSVRGRAFQAFVLFMYQDGKELSSDVEKIYEKVLMKENTRAIMFMFGRYLPSFYFRGENFIKKLLPKIFPGEKDKKYLYLAAWEGYLSENLYKEIFEDTDFQKLYKRGIELTDTDYPSQKHFRDPDEGLAIHLALAFMHYDNVDLRHPLLKKFWADGTLKQHAAFASFIGRSFISGDNQNSNELIRTDPKAKEKIKTLWNYLLENHSEETKMFEQMGFWFSLEKDIFSAEWLAGRIKKTLEKTNGVLDWDYGLQKTIERLAKDAPNDTLEILRLYLLKGGLRGAKRKIPLRVDGNEWQKAFEILYSNLDEKIKKETFKLINDLIEKGGSAFWGLKEVLEKPEK